MRGAIDCTNYNSDVTPYTRPTCRSQNDDRNTSHSKVLLIPEVPVSGDKHIEPLSFCRVKQITVRQGRPPTLVSGRDMVLSECFPQGNRRALIKQYAHLSRRQRALRRVLENSPNLVQRDAGKPLHEL